MWKLVIKKQIIWSYSAPLRFRSELTLLHPVICQVIMLWYRKTLLRTDFWWVSINKYMLYHWNKAPPFSIIFQSSFTISIIFTVCLLLGLNKIFLHEVSELFFRAWWLHVFAIMCSILQTFMYKQYVSKNVHWSDFLYACMLYSFFWTVMHTKTLIKH